MATLESEKEKLNKKAFVAGSFYVMTQLLIRGLTFITTPIYTRLVSTGQYGEIRIYESWLLILVPILSMCTYRSIERAKYDFVEEFEAFTSSVLFLSYILITAFLVGIICFKDAFMDFTGMSKIMFYFFIVYAYSHTASNFFQRHEKQLMNHKRSMRLSILTMIPAVLLSIALLYWGNVKGLLESLVDFRVIGYLTPQIIGGIFVCILMLKEGKTLINKQYWKYALIYSLPLIPEMLSIQIMNQSDKIMIQKLVNDECAGIFSLATTISFIIWIVEDSVWNAWLPWLYEKISRNQEKDIEKPWYFIAKLFAYFSWGLVMIAPELIIILGGKQYHDAIYLVAPMITGTLFRFYSYCYTAIQSYYKKNTYVALGSMLAMILNVCLNYVCILNFGYQAAAYTTAVSYFFLMILQGFLEKKVAGSRIIPLKKMIILSLTVFGINTVTMFAYYFEWYVRYLIIAIVCGLFIWRKYPTILEIKDQVLKK